MTGVIPAGERPRARLWPNRRPKQPHRNEQEQQRERQREEEPEACALRPNHPAGLVWVLPEQLHYAHQHHQRYQQDDEAAKDARLEAPHDVILTQPRPTPAGSLHVRIPRRAGTS